MRFVGVCLLWVLGAVACVALVIVLFEAFALIQAGERINAATAPDLVAALADGTDYLIYAAILGALLGAISLVPIAIRQNTERILLWGAFGAVSGAFSFACAVFLFKSYRLLDRGVRADEIPILDLLGREMDLFAVLPYGAIAGLAIAIVMIVGSVLRANEAEQAAAARYAEQYEDPDMMIRSRRAHRAQQYLADRDKRDPGLSSLG